MLCLVNRERAENGEPPLLRNAQLEQAAECHGAEMISDDYFQHVSPTGETPVDRIRATGYIPGPQVGYVIGENLAWGTLGLATPQAIVEAWIASPVHLANILEGQYRETGIGVAARASPPRFPTASPAPPTRRSSASSSAEGRSQRRAGSISPVRYSAQTRERRWS